MSQPVSLKQVFEEARKSVENWPEWKQRAYASYWQEESRRKATSESRNSQEVARNQAADK